MHLLATTAKSFDDIVEPVDLQQTPGDVVVLSFADTDLSALAAAWAAERAVLPSVRLAHLRDLKHPLSVDLWIDRVGIHAKVILVRLLGGLDWWRYGIERLAAVARERGIALAVLPGEDRDDPRLAEASTIAEAELAILLRYFREGGRENLRALLRRLARHAGAEMAPATEPQPVPRCAGYRPGEGAVDLDALAASLAPGRPVVPILFYRSLLLAADTAAIDALCEALHARGLAGAPLVVTSLKDAEANAFVRAALRRLRPAAIVTTTAFAAGGAAQGDPEGDPFDDTDAPLLQVVIAATKHAAWRDSARGLGAADLAMHVVLPELDGRVLIGAAAFKQPLTAHAGLAFTALTNQPVPDRVAVAADRIAALVRLRGLEPAQRRIAVLMPDYPGAPGRTGYAVGLDVPASVLALLHDLAAEGYAVADVPADARALLATLCAATPDACLPIAAYERMLQALPPDAVAAIKAAWGEPGDDPDAREGAFRFRARLCGNAIVALAPDRGRAADRRAEYHDPSLPPRHALVAFGLWLRHSAAVDAVVHMGAHGTLEWLPGKAVALSASCFPELVVGPLPVFYPFIVSNPGEAAQAKRRIAAVTIGHLPPPLASNDLSGPLRELEHLVDEYAQADGLDRKRRERLARRIVETARAQGLAHEAGVAAECGADEALRRIDAWLCDLKDLAIKDGLHVFGRGDAAVPDEPVRKQSWAGRSPPPLAGEGQGGGLGASASIGGSNLPHRCSPLSNSPPQAGERTQPQFLPAELAAERLASARAERTALLAALAGRRVAAGPAGSLSRGRRDVLPTGRNLFTADPRTLPTPTAVELACMAADEVIRNHLQTHGEMPKSLVIDLWGSATLRTGGEEIAQGLSLMGCRPVWDRATGRVTGIEVEPTAVTGRPRVDVTWRISGLFRDLFPAQIALIDAAVRLVAERDETDDENPLAAAHRREGARANLARIFGTAPGAYGAGIEHMLGRAADREDLGRAYLAAASHAYGGAEGAGSPAADAFAARVAEAELLLHTGDDPGRDLLEGSEDAAFVGGFAAAAAALGRTPDLIMLDSTDPQRPRARPLAAALARIVRGRAVSPVFIAGQMRHGPRGAAELAETVDRLIDFAQATDTVPSALIDLVHEAYLGDPAVRDFLRRENPAAARAIADRLDAARAQGLWHPRRNDVDADLTALRSVDTEAGA